MNENKIASMLVNTVLIAPKQKSFSNIRLMAQEILILDRQTDYSCNLDNCQALYPGTQAKLWDCPPYIITEVEFSTPPFAEGKTLSECPGWESAHLGQNGDFIGGDFSHINSITIQDGNGVVKNYSGEMIDKENRLVFNLEDITIKYGIETGKAEFYPHLKKSEAQTQAVQHKPETPEPPKLKHRGMHM